MSICQFVAYFFRHNLLLLYHLRLSLYIDFVSFINIFCFSYGKVTIKIFLLYIYYIHFHLFFHELTYIYDFLNIQTFHTIHESTQSIFAMAFVLFVNICNGFVNSLYITLFFFFIRVNISYK